MLNTAIVEDEQPAIDKLTEQLSQITKYNLVLTCNTPLVFLDTYRELAIDIVFVDINLPECNGVTLVEKLQGAGFSGAIIFTTAYSEFAVEAFTLGAVDYLLKPYSTERLALALSRVNRVIATGFAATLTSKVAGKTSLIDVSSIELIKLEYGQAIAFSNGQQYPIDGSLEEIQQQLPTHFLRVHRNAIVNQSAITAFERWVTGGYLVKLRDSNLQVVTSRGGAKLLKQQLSNIGLS
ncbi:LytTR family DNA-binding domain-containing protein [Pseudoalteromonas piscicida]|uniref:Two-component system, LytT family, response regulator n=1 Tax=Pseudoalteromonas piscicida TaxID=43662 RepID=A0ABN5C9W6_PSEO7|nr:LytTR family DNA-binding domain-containing protein [Pseudoalteromonas piscicida]ATD06160.1 two-component system, LytT family, response regulator [Pseudoalteromonas piscicida]WPU32913.1 LytTR family DNA-binding domain-containing protein [Pseudoalteromonas piscicida]